MNVKTHLIDEVKIAELLSAELLITKADDALDLLGNMYYQGFESIILQEKQITPDFFDLKTGLAGEVLQKFSNYRMRLAIVGDFAAYPGNSIRDFIFESNKNRHINFVASTAEALERLSKG